MSPLPQELVDRWRNRRENGPGEGTVYWHLLLGDYPQVRAAVQQAQDRLAMFSGLHMTPLRWLHITAFVAGSANTMRAEDMARMLAKARSMLSGTPPISVTIGRILYHPEAIVLGVDPEDALAPILKAALDATSAVTGSGVTDGPQPWEPHVTLCYSTQQQSAEPIISALGRKLPPVEVSIDALSLVIQRGPERLWNWDTAGTARLTGAMHRSGSRNPPGHEDGSHR